MSNVKKSMSPEELTLVRNTVSGLQQLIEMQGGENQAGEQEENGFNDYNEKSLMKAENEMSEEDKKEDEAENVKKSTITTPTDGASANDDAEDKIDENETKITEESLKEVAKAILGLTNVVKSQHMRQVESEKAITGILEGLGVAKELKIEKSVQPAQKNMPIANVDTESVKKMFKEAMSEMSVEKDSSAFDDNATRVRKNLGNLDVLNGLIGRSPYSK